MFLCTMLHFHYILLFETFGTGATSTYSTTTTTHTDRLSFIDLCMDLLHNLNMRLLT